MTQRGLRCFHCKRDVYPNGGVAACPCGRTVINGNTVPIRHSIATPVVRIVPDKR
jgi:hypothetical protein